MTPTNLQRIIEYTVTRGSGYSESYVRAPTTRAELSEYLGSLEDRKKMLYMFVITPIMVAGLEKCIIHMKAQNRYVRAAEDQLRQDIDGSEKERHSQYLPKSPLIN